MEKLATDWFIQGTIDFEYKKYLLLAYLQGVKEAFSAKSLYPPLSELVNHYRTLKAFKEDKQGLRDSFPRIITGLDLQTLKVQYEPPLPDTDMLEEVEMIVDYSLPMVGNHLELGKELYETIDQQMDIEPVGVVPLYKDAGYLLLRRGEMKELKAFEYQISVFQDAGDQFRSLSTRFVGTFETNLSQTPEAIKRGLISANQSMPNPATYLIFSPQIFPEQETLLPIAKRKLVRFLAMGA